MIYQAALFFLLMKHEQVHYVTKSKQNSRIILKIGTGVIKVVKQGNSLL